MSYKRSLMFVGGLSVLLFTPTVLFAAPVDYAHYYTFDEGYGRSVGDSGSSTHQNGLMVGTSTGFGWASGKLGNALGMDGAAGTGVVLPDGALTGSEGTLALWFKVNTMTDRNVLFSARSTTDRNIYMQLALDLDGRPTLSWRDSSAGVDRRAQVARPLNKNEWYQLVFVAAGAGYHAYVNGEEFTVSGENTGRWFPSFSLHTLTYRIGSIDSNVLQGSFDGYLDDVRIYDRALSLSEAVSLYDTTNVGVPTNPVGTAPVEVPATVVTPTPTVPVTEVVIGGSASQNGGGTPVVTLTPAERTAKIAEIKSLLVTLYGQLIELLKAQITAKQGGVQ